MPYLESHSTLFIHIPKCAGKSVEKCLSRLGSLRFRDEPIQPDWKLISACSRGRIKTMHLSYLDHLNLLQLDPDAIFSFAIVRNPYARLVSHYAYMHKNYQTAKEGVRSLEHYLLAGNSPDFRSFAHALATKRLLWPKFGQTDYLMDKEGNIGVQRLLRFEHLDREFADIKTEIARRNFVRSLQRPTFVLRKLPFVNAMPAYDYRDSYDQQTADLVFEIFRSEFELLNYPRLRVS